MFLRGICKTYKITSSCARTCGGCASPGGGFGSWSADGSKGYEARLQAPSQARRSRSDSALLRPGAVGVQFASKVTRSVGVQHVRGVLPACKAFPRHAQRPSGASGRTNFCWRRCHSPHPGLTVLRRSPSRWLAGALPRDITELRRCSCQALKPSGRLRLYEYFESIFAMSANANCVLAPK